MFFDGLREGALGNLSGLLDGVSGPRAGLPVPALAGKLVRTEQQHPVPHCPGLRPRQFGTGFWSVRISFPAKAGSKPAPEAGPGTGNTFEQPKLGTSDLAHRQKSGLYVWPDFRF